jgi:acyl-CoA reductase-like NAD-dependent aldehyde dehydrogenase
VTATKADPASSEAASGVADTVAALRDAQPAWEELGVDGRSRWVARYRDWLLDHSDRLVDLVQQDTGKPAAEAPLEVLMSIDHINYYIATAERSLRTTKPRPHNLLTATKALELTPRPYPVVGVITPWNYPLALSLFDAMPALLAGAAVVVKPSEFTTPSVRAAIAGWSEIGAPAVLVCVEGAGEVGQALVDEVDFVQFTGSERTGKLVAQQAAARLIPFGLELGGKDPAIVVADADLDQAVRGVAFGGLSNTGQMCTSTERVYVEESIHDEFVDRLVDFVGTLRQSADHKQTDLGPAVVDSQVDIIERHVNDAVAKGATVRCGGKRLLGGRYYAPTVLTGVDHSMEVMTAETFGPVLPVMAVADIDEAVALANDSTYGLSASVWTSDKARGKGIARRLEVGTVDINDAQVHLACFPIPQAGWKNSGIGSRLGGEHGILKYTRPHAITSNRIELSLVQKLATYPYTSTKTKAVDVTMRLISGRDLKRRLGLGRVR